MTASPRPLRQFADFAADIKLGHSVFALPFAVLAAVVAGEAVGGVRLGHVALVVVCMIFARTAAMAANRLLDARLDALNPRTANRAIPGGRLSRGFVATAVAGSAVGFLAGCAGFGVAYGNWLPLTLGPFVLAFLCGYPLMKRFTSLCHYYLGAALALAPICAEVAVAGTVSPWSVLLAVGVLGWTAGFDIIYATVDRDSDLATGVRSVPARLGLWRALWLSRATHAASVAAFAAAGLLSPHLGALYLVAVAAAGVLLAVEQALVRADDLSKVNVAFFTVNGVISLTIGILGVVDVLA